MNPPERWLEEDGLRRKIHLSKQHTTMLNDSQFLEGKPVAHTMACATFGYRPLRISIDVFVVCVVSQKRRGSGVFFGFFFRFWFVCLFVFAFFCCLLVCLLISKCCLKKAKTYKTKRRRRNEDKNSSCLCYFFRERERSEWNVCRTCNPIFFLLFGL